ncbi:MAG: AMP-binding protein, partial [Proteobacteria bacterium]|nr:AMP-binding protein [Pseudomonadota bacterium]
MNTADFLNIACAIVPERDAVIFEDRRTTYSQLSERVNRLANALSERGVTRGDRVAIFQVNCPEYMEAYFATAKTGAMFVPLNFRVKPAELEFQLGHARPKVILVGQRYIPMVREVLENLALPANCIALDGPHSGMDEYEEVLAAASDEEVMAEVTDDDISILMFTAGTTGRPKAVPLKFNALSSYALENVEPADPDREESNLLVVPLYHVAGIQ